MNTGKQAYPNNCIRLNEKSVTTSHRKMLTEMEDERMQQTEIVVKINNDKHKNGKCKKKSNKLKP